MTTRPDLDLGFDPLRIRIHLTRDTDFIQVLRRKDGTSWPAGTEIQLRFSTDPVTVWTATLDGDAAIFNVPYSDVNDVLDADPRLVHLFHTSPSSSDPTPWGVGGIVTK